ncbi:MAG: hypothetical protein ACREL7_15585 [Longimicrobiales bacterium]
MSSLAILIVAGIGGVIFLIAGLTLRAKAKKKSRPRVIEQPNSAYTPKLVLDRDSRHRWQKIPLDQIHEINRGEVVRLLDRVAAAGIDSLRTREREFLENLAVRLVPEEPIMPLAPPPDFRMPGDLECGTGAARRSGHGELHPPV